MKKKILIDADSLIYMASKDTIEESVNKLKRDVKFIFDTTDAEEYLMFLTYGRKNYRYDIYPEYKENRKKTKSSLKYLKTLKYLLIEEYSAKYFEKYEADDLVAYIHKKLKDPELVVCSTDKDVLKNCVGYTFDYKKNEFHITTKEEKKEFYYYQMLVGDSVDNIKGLPDIHSEEYRKKIGLNKRKGVGDVTALKIIQYWIDEDLNKDEELYKLYQYYYVDDETTFNKFTLNQKLIKLGSIQNINDSLPEYEFLKVEKIITEEKKREENVL